MPEELELIKLIPPETLKNLLYKKLNALRFEVVPEIVDSIKMTVDSIFEYYEEQEVYYKKSKP